MNFSSIQSQVFAHTGRITDGDIKDWERQKVRDDINMTLDEIMSVMEPYYWRHVDEQSLTLVAGTTVYTLADDTLTPIEFYTADERARPVRYVDPGEADWSGSRNTNATASYALELTWYPPTTTAAKSGTAASMTTNTATITKVGGTDWESTDVGKIIRLDGDASFLISAFTSATSITVDQTYIGKLSGATANNSPSSLSSVKWEVTPPGVPRVVVVPGVTEGETLKYRRSFRHRRLYVGSDTPDIPEKYHPLLAYGAAMRNDILWNKKGGNIAQLYTTGVERMKAENQAAIASSIRLRYEKNGYFGLGSRRNPYPRDMNFSGHV